jgi:hypothetical protein
LADGLVAYVAAACLRDLRDAVNIRRNVPHRDHHDW